MTGLASLAGVLLLVGMMVGGLYIRSLHTPAVVGQADARGTTRGVNPFVQRLDLVEGLFRARSSRGSQRPLANAFEANTD